MKGLLRKIKIAFIIFAAYSVVISLFFHFSVPNNSEQKKAPVQQGSTLHEALNDPQLQKTEQGKLFAAGMKVFACNLIGEACTDNPADADKNFDTSIFGMATNLIAVPYEHPPASGIYWAFAGLQNAGFIPQSYAAEGIGFASISGYTRIWDLMRRLSYVILVLVIMTIGFMVMFRMKLNAQTVISVENALPRIILSLLLITFSFAIAGMLIDFMYIIIGVAVYIFSQLNVGDLQPQNIGSIINRYIGSSISDIWPYGGEGSALAVGNTLFQLLPGVLKGTIQVALTYLLGIGVANTLAKFATATFGSLKGFSIQAATFGVGIGDIPGMIGVALAYIIFFAIAGWLPGFLLGLMIMMTILFLVFRIFFMLLTAYIKIVLFIIFAPLILLFEAVPGKSAFGYWFKTLFSELLTFPIVVVISLVGYAIVNLDGATAERRFMLPFLHGFTAAEFNTLIGLGIVLMIPEFNKLIKGLIGVKDLPMSFGIGTFLGGGAAVIGAGRGGVLGLPSLLHGLPHGVQQMLRGHLKKGPQIAGLPLGDFLLGPDQKELYERMGAASGQAAAQALAGTPPTTGGGAGGGGTGGGNGHP